MEDEKFRPVSVLRFVFAFLAVKVAAGGGLALYFNATGDEPHVSSTPITIAAIGLAMLWYSKTIKRPMTGAEIFKFSVGNMLADLALSTAWLLAMVWQLGAPLNWDGINAAMGGGGDPRTTQVAVAVGFVIGAAQVILLSVFFAWLMSRRLSRVK